MPEYNGTYDLAETTRYLYVTSPWKPPHYSSLRYWVRSGLPSNVERSLSTRNLVLTFEDLVSLRMVIALRLAGFSLQHVRKVHHWLSDTTRYPRPFALKDLWISDTEIFVEMEGLLSVTRQGQYAMDLVREWLKRLRRPTNGSTDLSFHRINGHEVASAWRPQTFVTLNPKVQFGAPCINGTRIPTNSVWAMHLAGDEPKGIASAYGIEIEKVNAALEWERKLAAVVS